MRRIWKKLYARFFYWRFFKLPLWCLRRHPWLFSAWFAWPYLRRRWLCRRKPLRHIIVHDLQQLTLACPAQWEGTTSDGRDFYARYRGGWFRVRINDEPFFAAHVGHRFDGYMDTEQMLELTGINEGGGP